MTEQIYATPCGNIYYWINKEAGCDPDDFDGDFY